MFRKNILIALKSWLIALLSCSVLSTQCTVPENIHTLPTEGIGISWGGGGLYKAKKFKEMYEAQLEFTEGWGGLRKNPFHGGSMDIFWNCTIY